MLLQLQTIITCKTCKSKIMFKTKTHHIIRKFPHKRCDTFIHDNNSSLRQLSS